MTAVIETCAGVRRVCRAPAFFVVFAMVGSASAATGGADLDEGTSLFGSSRYREAEAEFLAVTRQYPDDALAHFWLAYTLHKQGRSTEAEVSVRTALELDPESIDASYLAGLLALGRQEWTEAGDRFAQVRSAAPESALGASAARHLSTLRWRRGLGTAIATFEAGEYQSAAECFRELIAERPSSLVATYYHGYALYKVDDFEAALPALDAALRIEPSDEWSRYMRALTLRRLGRRAEASPVLEALIDSRDLEVAAEARAVLSRDSPPAQSEPHESVQAAEVRPPRARTAAPTRWQASTALGLDTNPAYIPESSYSGQQEAALVVAATATGEVVLVRTTSTKLAIAPRALVRVYPDGPGEFDLAQLEARVELSHRAEELQAWVGAGAGASSLGWRLFLDVEQIWAGGSWQQASWTKSRFTAGFFRRGSHLDAYQNLGALGLRAAASQRFVIAKLARVDVGYSLLREWAERYSVAWSGDTADPDPQPYQATLSADATFTGHGPYAAVVVSFPWQQLRLSSSLAYQRREYDEPEAVVFDVAGERSELTRARSDGRVLISSALAFEVAAPLFGFFRYDGVINRSSVSGGGFPTDRNYDRHLVLAGVEARF